MNGYDSEGDDESDDAGSADAETVVAELPDSPSPGAKPVRPTARRTARPTGKSGSGR